MNTRPTKVIPSMVFALCGTLVLSPCALAEKVEDVQPQPEAVDVLNEGTSPSPGQVGETEERAATDKSKETKAVKKSKSPAEISRKPVVWTSPYASTIEVMLPREAAKVRRMFQAVEPLYFGGKQVQEQALFETLARRDQEALYEAVETLEDKPWWRDLLESFSGIAQYQQKIYSNFFNTRVRRHMSSEVPFIGLRARRWGVASVDANYFVSLERMSFEGPLSLDPHVLKTHGGQARILYRPSSRFHLLAKDNLRKSNKIEAVEGSGDNTSIGNNVVSNDLGFEFRYFLTERNVIDLAFDYDYSRSRSQDALKITRGYQPKISFLRSFGSRVIARGFFLVDYLKTVNPADSTTDTSRATSFRFEPGLGGTIVLTRRAVFDADYSFQSLRYRGNDKTNEGHRINLKLNHELSSRITQSYVATFSKLEGKRSAISNTTGDAQGSTFESFRVAGQYGYKLTPLTRLSFTAEYTRTDTGGVPNNRKRMIAKVVRTLFGKRADLELEYVFDKNDGDLAASYFSQTVTMGLRSTFGAGRSG